MKYEGELEVMSISMIGIDHNMAPVDIRAKFAFTKKNAGEAMEKIKNQNGIYGCVIRADTDIGFLCFRLML